MIQKSKSCLGMDRSSPDAVRQKGKEEEKKKKKKKKKKRRRRR